MGGWYLKSSEVEMKDLIVITHLQGYLISCVWNCYRYINGRNSSDVLVYVTSNDTTVGAKSFNVEIAILCDSF